MTNKKRTVNKPNARYKKGKPHNVYNLVALFTLCSNFMLNRADKILLYQADSPSRRSRFLRLRRSSGPRAPRPRRAPPRRRVVCTYTTQLESAEAGGRRRPFI